MTTSGKLSRAEKNAATDARLLASARAVFAERGYHGASMDDVAEHAGLSKGALYYRYATKDDLFVALLDASATDRAAELAGARAVATDGEGAGGVRAQRAADQLVTALGGEDGWAGLVSEFTTRARQDPEFRRRLTGHTRSMRAEITALVEARADDLGLDFPVPAERLAVIIGALAAGLALERSADPGAAPAELTGTAVSLLFSGVAIAARRRA